MILYARKKNCIYIAIVICTDCSQEIENGYFKNDELC